MTNYEDLSGASKVWIFQADKELTETQQHTLLAELTHFTDNWLSHGSLLKAHFKILHKRFIVFFADEEGDRMCGRAIDASVRFIKEMETKYNITLLDRNNMAYIDENGNVAVCKLTELYSLIEKSRIRPETKVFNNLVQNKTEFEEHWLLPLSESWQQNYTMQNN